MVNDKLAVAITNFSKTQLYNKNTMLGIDRFLDIHPQLKGKSIGILTNHATLSMNGLPVAVELLKHGVKIRKMFSPEHGVSSQAEDGRAQSHGVDSLTQLPVVSLYGQHLKPTTHDIEDVDHILVDLPNIGVRFYTYWWTITYLTEALHKTNKKLWILDRPNLGTQNDYTAEGPILDEATCASFLGRWRMPLRHGYTYGQLAKWFIHQKKFQLDFSVLEHSTTRQSIPFVPPSPSLNSLEAISIYPFTGIFEGVNVSVGRGTSFPFQVIGAPWIRSLELAEQISKLKIPGLVFYPYSFKPMWSHYAGEYCQGIFIKSSLDKNFLPAKAALQVINVLSLLYPYNLKEALYPTAANPSGQNHLDLLLGMKQSFTKIASEKKLSDEYLDEVTNADDWVEEVNSFLQRTTDHERL